MIYGKKQEKKGRGRIRMSEPCASHQRSHKERTERDGCGTREHADPSGRANSRDRRG